MSGTATIKSAHDGTSLELSERCGGYYRVTISGPNFHGAATAYEYNPGDLKAFFDDLAANWRGWLGKKEWRSLEGELSLSATSDSTGHVTLSARIRSGPYPFDWGLSAVLLVEAGQLDGIAASIAAFLNDSPAE